MGKTYTCVRGSVYTGAIKHTIRIVLGDNLRRKTNRNLADHGSEEQQTGITQCASKIHIKKTSTTYGARMLSHPNRQTNSVRCNIYFGYKIDSHKMYSIAAVWLIK